MAKKKTHDTFVAEVRRANPNTIILGHYVDSKTKVECKCKKCGFIWSANPSSLVRGHGCRICGHEQDTKKRTKTTEVFKNELSLINPDLEVLGEYSTARKPIKCRCKKCGFTWDPIAGLLLRGRGCQSCSHSNTSFFEQAILLSFEKALGQNCVKSRDVSAIGKELDIYIPSHGFAIEPGGWFWHKDKIESDREKRELCAAKGISLWTIYDGYIGEKPPFESNCLCYSEDLSDTAYKHILVSLVKELFLLAHVLREFSENEWDEVFFQARINSRRKTTQEFIEELKIISPTISVVGEYINNITPIDCECTICGYKWSSTPSSLLSGSGCSNCLAKRLSVKLTKPNIEFTAEIKRLLPDVVLLEDYKNLKTKIKCQCQKCGNIWYAYPGNLLKACGCRKCSYKTIANKNRKSDYEFKAQLQLINPSIEITSQYLGAEQRIDVKCKQCGNKWSPRAADLLRGKGCPLCAKKKAGLATRKKNQDFVAELQRINDTIVPIDDYTKSSEKISVKCTICGNTWRVTPKSLLQGNGCPRCASSRNSKMREKPVAQYTCGGVLVQKYKSAKEASLATNSSLTGIQAVARGVRKTCNGFVWQYIEE